MSLKRKQNSCAEQGNKQALCSSLPRKERLSAALFAVLLFFLVVPGALGEHQEEPSSDKNDGNGASWAMASDFPVKVFDAVDAARRNGTCDSKETKGNLSCLAPR